MLQAAADAENDDNILEQKRQLGKKVLYGQVIQVTVTVQIMDVVKTFIYSIFKQRKHPRIKFFIVIVITICFITITC